MNKKSLWAASKLRLVVTSDCNINCNYCHNEGQPKIINYMSQELFDATCNLLDNTRDDLTSITITGGEPLLHDKIGYFIRKLKPFCDQITIVTNGYLLDQTKLESLITSGVTKIRIGVDSIEKRTPRPSASPSPKQKITDTIDMILEKSIPVEINVVLTEFNSNEILKILKFCHPRGISIKFFEHMKVHAFGTRDSVGFMEPLPIIDFDNFHKTITTIYPLVEHGFSPGVGPANYQYNIENMEIRYCKYLCPFGLCHITGTRIDPCGFVYVCMKLRGQVQLNLGEPIDVWKDKIIGVVKSGCDEKDR